METQPDKFFREKLQSYQRQVPATAWEKIENGLHKKKTGGFWIKVAASFALLAVTTYLLWPGPEKNTSLPSNALREKRDHEEIKSFEKNEDNTTTGISQQAELSVEQSAAKPDHKEPSVKEASKKNKPAQFTVIVPSTKVPEQEIASLEINIEIDVPEVTDPGESIALKQETSDEHEALHENNIKIILSSEEVNEKYLTKNKIAEATTDEKKSSTLKKLLDKAYDLKHNQDPVGDLRQMKNEILALNFKNEKQRGQNK